MMKIKYLTLILLIFAFCFAGCSDSELTENTPTDVPSETTMAPTGTSTSSGYPVQTPEVKPETGYPIAENQSTDTPQGPEFSISVPVDEGALVVTGTGPAEVPLQLVSVSEVGRVLAETVIDGEGNFTFNLDEPLEAGMTIGLMLGDVSGTEFNENDFVYSDTYYARPLIGILFDMAVVQQP